MKFASFPYTVQKEVLDQLSLKDTFFLSLCSKKTKNFIVQCQKYQFEKVEQVYYKIEDDQEMKIEVKMQNARSNETILYVSNMRYLYRRDLLGHRYRFQDINELGPFIKFFSTPVNGSELNADDVADYFVSTIKPIHNHLYDLLGEHTKFWCYVRRIEPRQRNLLERKTLPMFQNLQKMEIYGDDFETTEIDEFLSTSTRLEFFDWKARSYNQTSKLSDNSKIHGLDTVVVLGENLMANDLIKNFNGRILYTEGNAITAEDVIQFLKEWKSGEKFQNLEYIIMVNVFPGTEIRDSVDIKSHRKKVAYKVVSFDPSSEDFEFKSRLYMVRDSDGYVASVGLTINKIFMGVWKMSEREFLEKHQLSI